MTRLELITSNEYFEATIASELWRQAGEPIKGYSKFETKAKKIVNAIRPTIEEIIELHNHTK